MFKTNRFTNKTFYCGQTERARCKKNWDGKYKPYKCNTTKNKWHLFIFNSVLWGITKAEPPIGGGGTFFVIAVLDTNIIHVQMSQSFLARPKLTKRQCPRSCTSFPGNVTKYIVDINKLDRMLYTSKLTRWSVHSVPESSCYQQTFWFTWSRDLLAPTPARPPIDWSAIKFRKVWWPLVVRKII